MVAASLQHRMNGPVYSKSINMQRCWELTNISTIPKYF